MPPEVGIALLLFLAVGIGAARAASRLHVAPAVAQLLAGVALSPVLLGPTIERVGMLPTTEAMRGALASWSEHLIVVLVLSTAASVAYVSGTALARLAVVLTAVAIGVPSLAGLVTVVLGAVPLAPTIPSVASGLALGIVLSVSSLPVVAAVLAQLNATTTRAGRLILMVAASTDLLGWAAVGLLAALVLPTSGGSLAPVVVAVLLALWLGAYPVVRQRIKRPDWRAALGAAGLMSVVAWRVGAEPFSVAVCVGTVIAWSPFPGLERLQRIVTAAVVPICLVGVGQQFGAAGSVDVSLTLGIFALATGTKFFPIAAAALNRGLGLRDAVAVSAGLNARGLVEIVMAYGLYRLGLLDGALYLAVTSVALLTTCISLPVLSAALGRSHDGYPARLVPNSAIRR
jgi:Kef-type K+ transport system membrane component KefB